MVIYRRRRALPSTRWALEKKERAQEMDCPKGLPGVKLVAYRTTRGISSAALRLTLLANAVVRSQFKNSRRNTPFWMMTCGEDRRRPHVV